MGIVKIRGQNGHKKSTGNAMANDVISGKTFSNASGVGKTGTLVMPTLASFTADATATASDIKSGKIAYVNGNKVTGNYTPPVAAKSVTCAISGMAYTGWENNGSVCTVAVGTPFPNILITDRIRGTGTITTTWNY